MGCNAGMAPVSECLWFSVREVSSTILLATWVLLCYAAKREKKSLGCFGNHCTETKKKKQKPKPERL